jgi:hypothetical protein
MKRSQLIEYGIITVGLVCGYKFLDNGLSVLFQLAYFFAEGPVERLSILLPTFVLLAVYGICFMVLIRRSGQIATWLQGDKPNEQLAIKIDSKTLLHIVLTGIMIASIINHIPNVIIYLYESFKNQVSSKNLFTAREITVTKSDFLLSALQLIIAFLAIYFARTITGWLIRKQATDELTFQSEPETKN